MKFLILLTLILTFSNVAEAKRDADINFESKIPASVVCSEGSSIKLSNLRYKDGAQSLEWSWNSPSTLTINEQELIAKSTKSRTAGITLWIYNPEAVKSDLYFAFQTEESKEISSFKFHMDFTGWRACWIKYLDMEGDIRGDKVTKMVISSTKGVDSGKVYIDRLSFIDKTMNNRLTPDKQLPNAGMPQVEGENLTHWSRLWEWEQNVYDTPLTKLNKEQKKMLDLVSERLTQYVDSYTPSAKTVNKGLINKSLNIYNKAQIRIADDGKTLLGSPLVSPDECNLKKGEIRDQELETMLYGFAVYNGVNNSTEYNDEFFTTFDFAIDQGFAYGSCMGTNHHYGFRTRKLFLAMWLMRDQIADAGKTEEYVKVLEFWSALGESRQPCEYDREQLLDTWNTLMTAKIISAMMLPTEQEQYRAMQSLGAWISTSLRFTPGTIGGIKPDGSTFHHGGMYPAYTSGAFASLGEYCKFTKDTDFEINEEGRQQFKLALTTMSNYTNSRNWALGLVGRHPLAGTMSKQDVEAYGYLAVAGDLTGEGKSIDPELAGTFLRLGGVDKETKALIKDEGIEASKAPEGFFVYNYGAVGIHRRDNWMVTLKAYNNNVWGSEIYTRDNRYGRYQSYGTAPIIGSGNPVNAKDSGFTQDGWNWNRPPGATTIHLPFNLLNSPNRGSLMDRSEVRFSGASSLEGRNGVLAFELIESDRENFTKGATAKKSIFCFDNLMVFVGSGITNSNADYPTETTLYQLGLDEVDDQIEIDDNQYFDFPFIRIEKDRDRVVISDTKGNFYAVKNAGELHVTKKIQKSPNNKTKNIATGNFATAYINHGKAPQNGEYEYAVYVQPSKKQLKEIARKDNYTVIQKDDTAHVVKDLTTGITGYVCFQKYSSEGDISSITEQTIVMERKNDDGDIIMSICTPDLGYTVSKYTIKEMASAITKTVVLNGKWEVENRAKNTTVQYADGKTTISVACQHGIPIDLILTAI